MKSSPHGGEPFFFPGGRVGCLLIHGFTASPQEMRLLGEHLAGQGHAVLGIRLFAHATHLEDMVRARWRDWLASAEDGFHLLRDVSQRIVAMGLSQGGALALILAARFPVLGVVAMATPFDLPPDPRLRLLRPILRPLSLALKSIAKGPPTWVDPQAAVGRVAYTAYPVRAVPEVEGLLAAMRQILPEVRVPALLMHSRGDTLVPPGDMERIHDRLGTAEKTMQWVEHSSHGITLDADRETVFAAAADFVRRVAGGRS